jgi:spermidine synthase
MMNELPIDYTHAIYCEMLSHPALFSHKCPQKIALIGESNQDIAQELLKHSTVKEIWQLTPNLKEETKPHPLIHFEQLNSNQEINKPDFFDIVINTQPAKPNTLTHYFTIIHSDGIFLQLSDSPFQIAALKNLQNELHHAGFSDIQTLHFPQPNFPLSLRCALMAKKTGVFKKIREKDIFNKTFSTLYYNFDIHKAACVLPEFLTKELL